MLVKNTCTCCIYNNANSWSILDTIHISWFPVWVTIQRTPPWVYFGLQPIFAKILNFFDHSMLSVATFAPITSLTSSFFVRWQGLMFGATEKETLSEIYILDFHALASRWILVVKFLRVWPVMFIMTVVFIIGNLSWTVCSLTGSSIHKAAGIKWSAFEELFTEYWHTGTNSRHNKSNPMSWLVLDIKYRSKDVLQTM